LGVVRIDDKLDKEIEEILKREENRFRYPSKTAFLNLLIYDRLQSLKKTKK
jgi:hypothetical protein